MAKCNLSGLISIAIALLTFSLFACKPQAESTDNSVTVNTAAADNGNNQQSENDGSATQQNQQSGSESKMDVTSTSFGKLPDGREVKLFTMTNDNGFVVKMIDYGAIVVSVEVADRDGKRANVNAGFDNLAGYLQKHPYFGSTVGRYGNRIANGRFTIDGTEYTLAQNNEGNHLHGGNVGFDKVLWKAEPVKEEASVGVKFTYRSPDGEEGYPGNLDVTVTYIVTNNDELKIEYVAKTDKATPVNLTNHCYWNLQGPGTGTIVDHILEINADEYVPVNEGLIPIGKLAPVKNTPMDFRQPHAIGDRIHELEGEPQGYDHCYALNGTAGDLRFAARAKDPDSGRVLEIYTTQPGIQFYTGNFLAGQQAEAGLPQHGAFCLETQHFPDSPNQPNFPTTILKPGETYREVTVHRFYAE